MPPTPSSDGTSGNDASQEEENTSTGPHQNLPRREIRAAKLSIDQTGHGVTMTITAGKLRLRLYIESQWNDLVQQIAAGEGELGQLVPFRMAPFEIGEDAELVSVQTINAEPIPGLSADNPLVGTPLWNASFPSEDQED